MRAPEENELWVRARRDSVTAIFMRLLNGRSSLSEAAVRTYVYPLRNLGFPLGEFRAELRRRVLASGKQRIGSPNAQTGHEESRAGSSRFSDFQHFYPER